MTAPRQDRPPALALTIAAVAGGVALLLVGASAGRALSPASPEPRSAEAAMIVPAAKPVPTPIAVHRSPERATIGRAFPAAIPTPTAEEVATVSSGLTRNEAIARALGTGEFQEWSARDGTTGFAVAGPAEATPHGTCRALAILTRQSDGSDHVTSSRECRAAPAALQP